MSILSTSGYSRLLQKLGRAGRLTSMGDNKLAGTISYTMQYAPTKTFAVTIQQCDAFTRNYLPLDKRVLRGAPSKP